MPAARDYIDHTETGLSYDESMAALGYIALLQDMMVDHGFRASAVDAIQFDIAVCTVSSAGHKFSDGGEFYEITLRGKLGIADFDRSLPLSLRDDDQIALYLAVELAQNAFGKIDRLAAEFGKAAPKRATTAGPEFIVNGGNSPLEAVTATRRPLDEFFQLACDIFARRLKQIAPVRLQTPANNNGLRF